MIKKSAGNILCIALAVLFLPVFFSCSNRAEQKSIASALEQIDILINQDQFKDAERELNKIEKKSYSSWIEIGIFKRYLKLGNAEKAEKTLVRAIKKNPKNSELNAVYAHFLLSSGRTEDALAAGKILSGTRYGSVFSEAVLRNVLEKSKKSELPEIFLSPEYFSVYYDAYSGSKNPAWLRNCALLYLSAGSYEKAAQIQPGTGKISEANDGFFWSIAMYDAGHFGESVNYGNAALDLAESRSGKSKNLVSISEISAVLQDSYIWLGDSENAEMIREKYLDSISDGNGGFSVSASEDSEDDDNGFLPSIFVNSAKWAVDSGQEKRAVQLLGFCVEKWPDFVPGLISYADFSYNSNLERYEDSEKLQLRDEGLASLEMERYDSRQKIPLSDALSRIDRSLARKKSPLLYIVRLDLKYKTEKKYTENEKIADIWKLLEENALSPSVYPEVLFEYALNFLLKTKNTGDAWNLFYKYVSSKYEIACDNDFWTNVVKKINGFSTSEAEFAFYFSALAGKAADSVRLGEFCVFENEEKHYINAAASDFSAVNLAQVYNSVGRKTEALELYRKVNGRSSAKEVKSLAMYRMALIYMDMKDLKNARICAEYSSALNPRNAEAKLLLLKIKAAR